MRELLFRPRAEADLVALHDWIAERAGQRIATAYLARIEKTLHNLTHTPLRGSLREDIAPGLRVFGFERRVTIAFRVLDHAVEIVAIAHGGREWARELHPEV